MACLVYVIKNKTIFDHFTWHFTFIWYACKCCSKLFSRTAETRARSDETFFIKYMSILASVPTLSFIILENKTLNASFFIITSIFSKPGFCVRPVNRFFNSKIIYWYFLLMIPLCIALLRKTIPCSNSCSNVYPLQQHVLTICENQLYCFLLMIFCRTITW